MNTEQQSAPDVAPLVNLSISPPQGFDSSQGNKALTYANDLTIETAEDSVFAQGARASINSKIKTMNEARMALTRPIDIAKKTIMDFFATPIAMLEQAKAVIDSKVIDFDNEQERIRKEAQRKVEADAQRERDRLAAEAAERQRLADAETKRLREEAEAKAAEGDQEAAEKLAAKAARVEERAAQRVEVLQDRAATVVAPIIQAQSAKASGSSFRDNFKFRVKDQSKLNSAFLMTIANEDAIQAIVKSMKGNAAAIEAVVGAGAIEIYNERIVASRRA